MRPYLGVVAIAGYLQTICGFALGLVVVGVVALTGLVPLASVVIVVSILSLAHAALMLYRDHHHARWRMVGAAAIGLVPAVALGVALLETLSATSVRQLNVLLGAFIVVGAAGLMLRPRPRSEVSARTTTLFIGLIAGVFSGLFSSGGPALVYHLYRQPFPLSEVHAALVTLVAVATSLRIGYVGIQGDIIREVLELSALSVPVVFAATFLGKRFAPPLTDTNMRRIAFGLLLFLGVMLLVS